jgi:acetyl-CoA/propionyl-CoA carboxylase biotin carboxyl carrier protein
MAARTFSVRGEEIEVAARRNGDRLAISISEGEHHEWHLRHVGAAEFVAREVDDEQRTHTVHAVRDRTTWWVHLDGRTYRFQAVLERGGAGSAAGDLTAPIPATVAEVLVANGDQVEAEQVLLVLSAMKMQLEVRAPHSGTVANMHLTASDPVDGGQQLLTIVATEAG